MTIDTKPTGPTKASRLAVGAAVFGLSSTLTACAVVWGFEDPQDPAESPALVGDGSIAEGRAPGCEQEKPDENAGVFVVGGDAMVEAGVVEDPLCGAKDVPCVHIGTGLSRAKELGRSLVYVVRGTYTEALNVPSGMTVQGGWNALRTGGTLNYARACADAPGTTVIIQAPEDQATAVLVDDTAAPITLTDLTVRSKTKPAASESVYGIRVRGVSKTPNVTLTDVFVVAGSGGNGDPGKPATTGAAGVGSCQPPYAGADAGAPVPNGDAGAPAAPPSQGKFGPDGIAASNGLDGAQGARGNNGAPSIAPMPVTSCLVNCKAPALLGSCSSDPGPSVTGNAGGSGCGGAGGGAGHGGGGGGSSVGVYAWNATITTTRGGLTSGNGGVGGAGSPGANGGTGALGANGTDSAACITDCGSGTAVTGCGSQMSQKSSGTPGTKGSTGGTGGQGSAGAGGDSFAIALGGMATAKLDPSTILAVGAAGSAPAGGVAGKAATKGAP